jgi:hypothetical protein
MPGAVQVVNGDMFSGPADLIVMPCSTGGTVTWSVRARMQRFALPPVPSPIPLGEVRRLPLTGADHVAQFVAYAASVRDYESSPEAIEHIGEELGRATHEEDIQVVPVDMGLADPRAYIRLASIVRQQITDGTLQPGRPAHHSPVLAKNTGTRGSPAAKHYACWKAKDC